MESYNLCLQTPALPQAVDCPWTQGKPRDTMLHGVPPSALLAHPHPRSPDLLLGMDLQIL